MIGTLIAIAQGFGSAVLVIGAFTGTMLGAAWVADKIADRLGF